VEHFKDASGADPAGLAGDLYAAFFEHGLDACLLSRPGGGVLVANTQACRLFGYSSDELIALGRAAVTVEEDPRLEALLAERERQRNVRGRLTLRRKDGSRFEAEVASTIFRIGADDSYATLIVRDLTETLRGEQARRESEERLRFTLEAANIGHWDTDLITNEGFRSPSLFTQFGFAGPVAGWNFAAFMALLHPDDRARVGAAYQAAVHTGAPYDEEFRVVWPDSSVHRLWAKGLTYLDPQGVPRRMLGVQIDITARHEAMARLAESEARFRSMADAAPVMIWMTDASMADIYCNRAWLDLTGRAIDAPRGNGWQESIHPDDLAAVQEAWPAAFNARAPYRQEYRMRNARGSYSWLQVEARPRLDAGGAFLGYIGSSTDITLAKEAALALREAEERLRLVVEGSNDAPWDLNLETGAAYYSPRWWHSVGYAPGDLPAGQITWERLLHPQDLARVLEFFHAQLAGTGHAYEIEFRLRHKDGHYVPVLSRGYILRDAVGQAIRVSGTNTDLTERLAAQQALADSEQRHRFLIDHLTAGVVVHGADSSVLLANAAAAALLGLTPAQMMGKEAMDTSWSFWREDGTRMPIEEYPVVRVMATRKPLTNYVLGIDKSAGAERSWVLVNAFPKTGVAGELEEVIVTFADISALKRAELTHRDLEAQLREAQKMEAIGTLAGGIAHDFNNIIGTILGNTELARQDLVAQAAGAVSATSPDNLPGNPPPNTGPVLQSLEEIRKAGQRARDLVRQILSFSRRQPTTKRVLELPGRVDEVVRLLRSTLLTQTTIEATFDADAPNVLADPVQVDQALLNLITNATHAMDGMAGKIQIHVDGVTISEAQASARPALPPGRYARVRVRDAGHGMDAATLARIFEPFYTTKPVGIGTGLGLSVVYGIMQTHGGAVTAESMPGAGSTFTLYFPGAQEMAAAPEAPAEVAGGAEGRARRILYIDDDQALTFLVQRLLARRGYSITDFTHAHEALAALRADPAAYDLVLTDYNMPGMTGLDVARAVRQIRPDLPIAIASGFITEEMRAQAAAIGVQDLIFKPNAVEEYCEVVDRLALDLK